MSRNQSSLAPLIYGIWLQKTKDSGKGNMRKYTRLVQVRKKKKSNRTKKKKSNRTIRTKPHHPHLLKPMEKNQIESKWTQMNRISKENMVARKFLVTGGAHINIQASFTNSPFPSRGSKQKDSPKSMQWQFHVGWTSESFVTPQQIWAVATQDVEVLHVAIL